MCCSGARDPGCDAIAQKDGHRLHVGARNGSKSVLRSNGYVDKIDSKVERTNVESEYRPSKRCGIRRAGRWESIRKSIVVYSLDSSDGEEFTNGHGESRAFM